MMMMKKFSFLNIILKQKAENRKPSRTTSYKYLQEQQSLMKDARKAERHKQTE
jgi:hypothetical protein